MSAQSGSDETRSVIAKAKVKDPVLAERVEAAADKRGSRAEVVRDALSEYLNADADPDRDNADDELPALASTGYETLVKNVGRGNTVDISAAESIIANACNIKKEAVRSAVFSPLKQESYIRVIQLNRTVLIEVIDREVA